MGGSAAVKGGSAVPHRKGRTTSSSSAHVKPKKKVSHPEQVVQKPKKSIWITLNRYAYQPKVKTHPQCLDSNFVLQHNSKGEVFASLLAMVEMFIIMLSFGFLKFL